MGRQSQTTGIMLRVMGVGLAAAGLTIGIDGPPVFLFSPAVALLLLSGVYQLARSRG